MANEMMTITDYLQDVNLWKGLFFTACGTFAHFVNATAIKKQTSFQCYWTENKATSIISVLGAIIGFAYLYEQDTVSILAYVGMGYISNSVFNRAAGVANALTSPDIAAQHARQAWLEKHGQAGYGGGYPGGGYADPSYGRGPYNGGGMYDSPMGQPPMGPLPTGELPDGPLNTDEPDDGIRR